MDKFDDLLRRFEDLNEIGAALSNERNIEALLEKILLAAKAITHADGGTLYRTDESGEHLSATVDLIDQASAQADIPAFVMGESLLGGAGELPLFGVLRVCVPEGYEEEAAACLQVLSQEAPKEDGDLDEIGDPVGAR